MYLIFSNGFIQPAEAFANDDALDTLVKAAAKRRFPVCGVRSVRFVAGGLQIEFIDSQGTKLAKQATGWQATGTRTLYAPLQPRDGVSPAVLIHAVAYGDYMVEDQPREGGKEG